MINKFCPSPDDLKKAIEDHIHYEIQQLIVALKTLPQIDSTMLESALIHVRILRHFFEKKKRSRRKRNDDKDEQDDVLSKDYEFPASPIKWPIDIEEYGTRLNKDLAHLTYSRVAHKDWPVSDIALPVLQRCEDFAKYLISEHLQTKYHELPELHDKWRRLQGEITSAVQRLEGTHYSAATPCSVELGKPPIKKE
jgi:hypothetical protein